MTKTCNHQWLFARDNDKNGYLICNKCGKEDWGKHEKYLCNPLDENSTLNMDKGGNNYKSGFPPNIHPNPINKNIPKPRPYGIVWCENNMDKGGSQPKRKRTLRLEATPKVHRFKKKIKMLFGETEYEQNMLDKICEIHQDEMVKLLERVEKEVVGEDEEPFGNNDDTVDGMNSLRWEQRKKLNNLREELK